MGFCMQPGLRQRGAVHLDGRERALGRQKEQPERRLRRQNYEDLYIRTGDRSGHVAAGLQTRLLLPLIYPVIRDGRFKSRFLQKRLEKRAEQMGEYVQAFMRMLGGGRPYVSMRSCRNQFYSDLVTPLPDGIDVPGTEIHIFYALKMGEKYRARYLQHFAHPILHEQDMQHEELLACHPAQWAQLVTACAQKENGQ